MITKLVENGLQLKPFANDVFMETIRYSFVVVIMLLWCPECTLATLASSYARILVSTVLLINMATFDLSYVRMLVSTALLINIS